MAAAVLAAALVGAAGVGLWVSRSPESVETAGVGAAVAATEVVRPALAILGFKNIGPPEFGWISTAVTEMLRAELGAGGEVRTIPGESVTRLKQELSLAEVDSLAPDTLEQVRSIIGADYVVLGSYLALQADTERQVRLNSVAQDAVGGEVLTAFPETGTEDELFALVGRTSARLREELGLAPRSAEDDAAARASVPTSPEATRLYAEGLAKLRAYDAPGAKELFEQALAIEPDHPQLHAALATAWATLGYDARAQRQAALAVEHAEQLPRTERLVIEARQKVLESRWEEAIEILSSLLVVYPDSLDVGLQLAEAYVAAARPGEALEVLREMRSLPAPASEDPRIDLTAAAAAKIQTDFEAQRSLAVRAAESASAIGARLLVARARLVECDAEVQLGIFEEAREACEDAKATFAEVGDGASVATAENSIAVAAARSGDLEEAQAGFQRALDRYETVGDRSGTAKQLNNLANVLSMTGELAEAEEKFERSLAIYRELEDRNNVAKSLTNVGATHWDEGELEAAVEAYEEALSIFRELEATYNVVLTLENLGEVFQARGELDRAEGLLEEALTLARDLEDGTEIAFALVALAAVQAERGELDAAIESFTKARERFAAVEDHEGEAMALRALGDLHERRDEPERAAAARSEAAALAPAGGDG